MVIPINIKAKAWFASLVIDFPDDNIPILDEDSDWKEKGNLLIQENSFAIQNAPPASRYRSFSPWAMEVFKTMNNF